MFQFPGFASGRLCIRRQMTARLSRPRFRIQKSPDQRLIAGSPELIAGFHVFRRLSMPRHPPCTLKSLTTFIDHRQTSASCECRFSIDLESTTTSRKPGRAWPGRLKPTPFEPCGPTGSVRINNGSLSPKKVLDDIRPTERQYCGV